MRVTGRTQIPDFLAPGSARALRDELRRTDAWHHVISSRDKIFESSTEDYDRLRPDTREALERAMNVQASTGFHFQFDNIRVDDAVYRDAFADDNLVAFAQFMNGAAVQESLVRLCDNESVNFVDVQATRYRAGDFLTRHDDGVEGKHRIAAFVLGLVDEWRAEWGGLLMFLGPEGRVTEAFVPEFNTLSVFMVGQSHFVSPVASYAGEARLALTGWLRPEPG